MNITPITGYRYGNYSYYHIAPPLPNRAEITMGMFSAPSVDPLQPSSTIYGTNASAINGDYRYVTSAETLASYVISESSTTTPDAQAPVNTTTDTQNNIYKTNESHMTEAVDTYRQTNIFKNTPQLQPQNDMLTPEQAVNFAATNANYNVNFSSEAADALKKLGNFATKKSIQDTDLSKNIDGYIYVTTELYKEKVSNMQVPAPHMEPRFSILKPVSSLFKTSNDNDSKDEVEQKRPYNFKAIA